MSKLSVLHVEAGKRPEYKEVDNELETFQKLIDGYMEIIRFESYILIINEEGKIHDLEPNFRLPDGDYVAGSAVFVNVEGEEFASLTKDEAEHIKLMLGRL